MKNKMIIFSLIILILVTCSTCAFAEDNLDNLTTSADVEIEAIEDNIGFDDISASSSEITITDDNYNDYFNKYTGNFKSNVNKESINTIKIGNVSDKLFTFDVPVNVMPSSDDVQIKNGVIHLIAGSSGSNITNLIINNTKGEIYSDGLFISKLHGIWLSNSSNNYIFNNTIRIPGEEGCYAMPMGYSSRNKILYNDIVSTFTSCILMGSCDYNNISYNRIETISYRDMVTSNLIFFNSFRHADYSGPADCIGTYISNNFLKGYSNGIWSIIINMMGKSDNTRIINNTIIKGSTGIAAYDSWTNERQAINITILNNTVINSTVSIFSSSNDVVISNNNIIGSSMSSGIYTVDDENSDYKSNILISNNYIDYKDLSDGMAIDSSNSLVKDNIIKISNFGNGIVVAGVNSTIKNNIISVKADDGICISKSNISLEGNFISTYGNGVKIISAKLPDGLIIKYYNNSIVENTILSDKYAVYIEGYVYDTLVQDNIIETNQSEAFYVNVEQTLEDKNSVNFTDNSINGVIENTETLIIDDSNFYDYFDENGYLTYSFKPSSKKMLFFTFLTNKDIYLTDQIILTSNKMPNLLYNVSITLMGDASESKISDFNFYNFDKSCIILDGVEGIEIKNNDLTTISSDIFEVSSISVIRGCLDCVIEDNNIFMSSKAKYTYAIYVSESPSSILKRFSRNFIISNNNILIKTTGVGEGMYFDALVDSDIVNNSIGIFSDGSAYGISACNVFGTLNNLNLDSNEIYVNSKEMSYLIEIYRCNNSQITNNNVFGFSNGVYGIGIYDSQDILIRGNEIDVCGLNLTDSRPDDALGKGNSAIYITRYSQISEISNNVFDCENTSIITKIDSEVQRGKNSFVISNYNHDLYFDDENKLKGIVSDNDIILFKNFTDSKIMKINIPVTIGSYNNHLNEFKSTLILCENASNSNISMLKFENATICLDNTSCILISNNSFISSNIIDINGSKNVIMNNTFSKLSNVNFNNSSSDIFDGNDINVESKFINIINSNYTLIYNNSFCANDTAINSFGSLYNSILNNTFDINASYGYMANSTCFDNVFYNQILIDFNNPTAICYTNNSSSNAVRHNKIISHSKEGLDYAIVVDSDVKLDNIISNNYLIASNGYKRGDSAVNASYDLVCNNTPVTVYVSVNGSEDGDGSLENPYSTISKAVENSLSGAIIHILPGMYNESGIMIDKNITLTAENIEGNTYINALNKQLFKITGTGILTVNALKIFNGFSVEGGSLFDNHGTLIINNSLIYNSSSYYDNSNPTFAYVKSKLAYLSHECSDLGLGGAILNHGELIITSSTLFNNLAHKGGVIADFGKTTIKNSLIFNNSATHGGAIFTESNEELTIENSVFINNTAVTTLDYCTIKRAESYNFGAPGRYIYSSACDMSPGHGGVIYAQSSINIKNSLFEDNKARCGGAIAFYSDVVNKYSASANSINYYSSLQNPFASDYNLNIENSTFRHNEAKDTQAGNLSLLKTGLYQPTYAQNCHGGAIFGSLNEFSVKDSLFEYNAAYGNGGAFCIQAQNSTIESSKFYNNTAGSSGGALDLFGNYNLFNTDISNNYAKLGGAIQYSSYSYYDHVINDMNAFNVTISNNMALERGGAFVVTGNVAIKHSNIYGNTAPEGSTISGLYSTSTNAKIDARSNWWGSSKGPDSSVLNQFNVRYRTWLSDKVNWDAISIKPSNDDDINKGRGYNSKTSNRADISTGSSIHTGSTLSVDTSSSGSGASGFNFNGVWPNGNGNAGGNYGNDNGASPFNTSGQSRTDVSGNIINPNSLSKSNSSSVNDLASVGMTANAADSSPSAQSSSSEGGSGESGSAYEITKEVKKEIDDDLSIINLLFILLWIFLFIGFYRKYREENA